MSKLWGDGVSTLEIDHYGPRIRRLLLSTLIETTPPSPPAIWSPISTATFICPASAQDHPPTRASPVSVPAYQENPVTLPSLVICCMVLHVIVFYTLQHLGTWTVIDDYIILHSLQKKLEHQITKIRYYSLMSNKFDTDKMNIIMLKNVHLFIMMSDESRNNQPNNNGVNDKLKSLYIRQKVMWN